MDSKDIQTKENNHDISIALIQKDVQYVRETLAKMETTLTMMDRNYTKRDEFQSMTEVIKSIAAKLETKADHKDIAEILKSMEKKVDHSDFDPIKKVLTRINWVVIAAFIAGLLSLVVKVSKT